MIVAYIDVYKHQFGLSPICRVLTDHDLLIAPSTYYAAKRRPPSHRRRSDERLVEVVKRVHRDNFSVYGVRKVWHALRREGHAVGRDQVARLMRIAGVRGQTRRSACGPPSRARAPRGRRIWCSASGSVTRQISCGWQISRTCRLGRGGCTCRSCRMVLAAPAGLHGEHQQGRAARHASARSGDQRQAAQGPVLHRPWRHTS